MAAHGAQLQDLLLREKVGPAEEPQGILDAVAG